MTELRAVAEQHPEDGGVLYNLACAESMDGQAAVAFTHLRRAIELDPSFRELAEKDSDFDPIREDPDFVSAVAGQPDTGGSGP